MSLDADGGIYILYIHIFRSLRMHAAWGLQILAPPRTGPPLLVPSAGSLGTLGCLGGSLGALGSLGPEARH